MIRRPAHGATTRPPLPRPGSGFGRPARPGPSPGLRGQVRDWCRRSDPIEALLVGGPVDHPGQTGGDVPATA